MKILETSYYHHSDKSRIKEDILDIGKVLNILKNDSTIMNDGVLLTWIRAYNSESVIYNIDHIAQALKITENTCYLNWRDAG